MLESLRLENYKCFSDSRPIKIAPLTVLIGENNSGKSAIIHALNILGLTQRSEEPEMNLRLQSDNYDYGSYSDIVFEHNEKNNLSFSCKLYDDDIFPTEPNKNRKRIYYTVKITYEYLSRRKQFYLKKYVLGDHRGFELIIDFDKYTRTPKARLIKLHEETKFLSKFFTRNRLSLYFTESPFAVLNLFKDKYDEKTTNKIMNQLYKILKANIALERTFRSIQHLGPIRSRPERSYLYTGEVKESIGSRGEIALQNYTTLADRNRKDDKEALSSINNALFKLGFFNEFNVRKYGKRYYEFWSSHSSSNMKANLADSGFGASQVLPVLIALYTSKPHSTLLFEQPEIHLHPAAQAELGSILVDACSDNKRIIVETHSENLLLRIQTEIAKGNISHKDVIFHYIQPKKYGHKVIQTPLDEKGKLTKKWPKGFFVESYKESLKLSNARRKKR